MFKKGILFFFENSDGVFDNRSIEIHPGLKNSDIFDELGVDSSMSFFYLVNGIVSSTSKISTICSMDKVAEVYLAKKKDEALTLMAKTMNEKCQLKEILKRKRQILENDDNQIKKKRKVEDQSKGGKSWWPLW